MLDQTIKSMTNKLRYSAIVSLILVPLVATSQDEDTGADEMVGPMEQTVPVADEVAPPAPQPGVVTEEQLLEEFARYRRLLQSGTLDEADVAAKRIVEMAIRVYGPQSRETASALNNLGIVQHGNNQYDLAIQNFTSSVEILEIVEDRLNGSLVNPLKGLGAAQLASGRPDLAQATFHRAAHITHVNEGPHNLDQVEILESIAETFIRMGDTKEARSILDRIHVINVKHFEKNPMGLLPSLMNRASWQHRAGYYAEERSSYRRAIRIVESSAGSNDPMLVEPLRRLGESFYYVDINMATPQQQGIVATGEMYFKRASRIAERSKDFYWRDLAKTKVALADYYTFTEAQNRSRKIYRQVWESLSEGDDRLAFRNELFADPVAIRTESLPVYAGGIASSGSSRNDLIAGRIIVSYDVSSRGRVRELQTEAIPPEFTDMQRTVHREIRRRIFRPRIADGEAVESIGLIHEHAFSYVQSDLDALRAAQAPAPSEQETDSD
jgi:tetratricopeptide (TPR) repeat protein